jgi:threonine/homoserine/homoserine lactone efflux protein
MTAGALWLVGSFSFVTALSGALMPGPLFTYTVARTLDTERRAWLTGARVIAGHAAIEALLVLGLVLGVVEFLRAPLAAKIIGVVGALLLLFMGGSLLWEVIRGRGAALESGQAPRSGMAARLAPPAAGVLVTMGNPYWWIWWLTIGAAFLVRFDITLAAWPLLLAFFVGHELGDLGWYLAVSTLLSFGRRSLPKAFTTVLLGACGAAMIGFAFWLGLGQLTAKT